HRLAASESGSRARRRRARGSARLDRTIRTRPAGAPRDQPGAALSIRSPRMKRFEDKVAIVTGAGCVGPGWGNGRATAVRFAEEGARVVAVDLHPEHLAETLERAGDLAASMRTARCDVTDAESVAALAAAALHALGRLDAA